MAQIEFCYLLFEARELFGWEFLGQECASNLEAFNVFLLTQLMHFLDVVCRKIRNMKVMWPVFVVEVGGPIAFAYKGNSHQVSEGDFPDLCLDLCGQVMLVLLAVEGFDEIVVDESLVEIVPEGGGPCNEEDIQGLGARMVLKKFMEQNVLANH